MPIPVSEWWIRRLCRWIDVERRKLERREGRRFRVITDSEAVARRYYQLKNRKRRGLLTIDHCRRKRP